MAVGKMLNISSCFSVVVLLYLFGWISILQAEQPCDYFKENDPRPSTKWCPNVCCSNRPRRENTTCCATVIIATSTTWTIFRYNWWIIFLCILCLFTAISIAIHYVKRMHFLKHSKYFNSFVEPNQAFTICKTEININPTDSTLTTESLPPSYQHSRSPSPPPYTSVHA